MEAKGDADLLHFAAFLSDSVLQQILIPPFYNIWIYVHWRKHPCGSRPNHWL